MPWAKIRFTSAPLPLLHPRTNMSYVFKERIKRESKRSTVLDSLFSRDRSLGNDFKLRKNVEQLSIHIKNFQVNNFKVALFRRYFLLTYLMISNVISMVIIEYQLMHKNIKASI